MKNKRLLQKFIDSHPGHHLNSYFQSMIDLFNSDNDPDWVSNLFISKIVCIAKKANRLTIQEIQQTDILMVNTIEHG